LGKSQTNQKEYMKTISNVIVVAAATVAASLQAQVISWNADANGTISGANVAGVVLAANWNDSWLENGNAISPYGSPTVVNSLVDNSGTATTLNMAYQAWGFWSIQGSTPGQDADGTYNRNLLNGYLNAGPAGWGPPVTTSTIALSQIPYAQYDIYVYFSADVAGRTGTLSDGLTTYSFSTAGPASISGANAVFAQTTDTGALYPTANYAVFSGLTGSSQTLTGSPLVNDAWSGIAGFQIVAVPEPGTMALAGLGGLAMMAWMKRRPKKG
jgi:hypothetical protein